MSTVQQKVDALVKSKTREEMKHFMDYVKQSAAIKAISEIADFVKQAEIESDTDALIANVASSVIDNMQKGFVRLLNGKDRHEVEGIEISKMTTNILRQLANHIDSECLRLMKSEGGMQ